MAAISTGANLGWRDTFDGVLSILETAARVMLALVRGHLVKTGGIW